MCKKEDIPLGEEEVKCSNSRSSEFHSSRRIDEMKSHTNDVCFHSACLAEGHGRMKFGISLINFHNDAFLAASRTLK